MLTKTAERVVGVRFTKIGKLYYFDVTAYPELEPGDYVVVETTRSSQLGQIIGVIPQEKIEIDVVKPIKRPANARDLMMKKLYEAKEVEALIDAREIASKLRGLGGCKFLKATYNFDGSMLTVLYTSEEVPDISQLRQRLGQHFQTRIDLRRVGARDAAKLLGEYGACGGPRCCSTFLTEFSPISIKMAKAQGISLNPSEITGMCGRLRCCLVYEYEQYVEAAKQLPRRGKMVSTPHGEGKIIDVNPLAETGTVIIEGTRYEVHRNEMEPLNELRTLRDKAGMGCTKEGQAGPCECGARVRSGTPSAEKPAEPEKRSTAPEADQGQRGEQPQRSGQRRGGPSQRGKRRSGGGRPGERR